MSPKTTTRTKMPKPEAKTETKPEMNPFEGFSKALVDAAHFAAEMQKLLASQKVLEEVTVILNSVFEKNKKIVSEDVSAAFSRASKAMEAMKGIKTKQPVKPKPKDETSLADRVAKGIVQATKKNTDVGGGLGLNFFNVKTVRVVTGNSKKTKDPIVYVLDPPVCGNVDSDEFKFVMTTYHIKQEDFDVAMKRIKMVEFVKKAHEATFGTKGWYNAGTGRTIHGKPGKGLTTVEITVLGLNLRIAYDEKGLNVAKTLGIDLGQDDDSVDDCSANGDGNESVHSEESATPLFP